MLLTAQQVKSQSLTSPEYNKEPGQVWFLFSMSSTDAEYLYR